MASVGAAWPHGGLRISRARLRKNDGVSHLHRSDRVAELLGQLDQLLLGLVDSLDDGWVPQPLAEIEGPGRVRLLAGLGRKSHRDRSAGDSIAARSTHRLSAVLVPYSAYSMKSFTDQQRFVLAVGDAADQIAEDSAVKVLDRLDRVVLAEASYRTVVDLRNTAGVVIHIFEREADARRVFKLFEH